MKIHLDYLEGKVEELEKDEELVSQNKSKIKMIKQHHEQQIKDVIKLKDKVIHDLQKDKNDLSHRINQLEKLTLEVRERYEK